MFTVFNNYSTDVIYYQYCVSQYQNTAKSFIILNKYRSIMILKNAIQFNY